jgi:osmotically-inducible protein OsmY
MVLSTLLVSHPHGCDLEEQAQERLRATPYVSFRDVRCEYRHGLLILRGQVLSYYEKQLAQEAVARLEGITRVVNELEVTWDDSKLQRRSAR